MKKFLPIAFSMFALIITNEALGMQAPKKARRVSQQPMMGQPMMAQPMGRQPMQPAMEGQAQPPAEIQNLLKQNAEAIEKLLKQVENGQLEPAKATVKEIRAIRAKLEGFMKQQMPQAPATAPETTTMANKAKQIK